MPRAPGWRPWVSANFATTWDGRISTRMRTPSDFSSRTDKRRFLEIRAMADAVLVGAKTVEADRMTVGVPSAAMRKQRVERGQTAYPLRVLVTNSGRVDPEWPIFSKRFSPIHIYTTKRMPVRTRSLLPEQVDLHIAEGGKVDLAAMMKELRKEHGVRRLHCEGGGAVLRSLLEADLLDELYLTLCPVIFGSREAPTLSGEAGSFLAKSVALRLTKMETIGRECFLRYRVVR